MTFRDFGCSSISWQGGHFACSPTHSPWWLYSFILTSIILVSILLLRSYLMASLQELTDSTSTLQATITKAKEHLAVAVHPQQLDAVVRQIQDLNQQLAAALPKA